MSSSPVTSLNPYHPPPAPLAGMQIWVQHGAHWASGELYEIDKVTSRSFFVVGAAPRQRHELSTWDAWVRARLAEGQVEVDGYSIGGKSLPLPADIEPDPRDFGVDLAARDRRFLKAAGTVLRSYDFEELPPIRLRPTLLRVAVSNGSRRYVVQLTTNWSRPPACSCPDASQGALHGSLGFCKHVIAVCLRTDQVRCQLLDLLI